MQLNEKTELLSKISQAQHDDDIAEQSSNKSKGPGPTLGSSQKRWCRCRRTFSSAFAPLQIAGDATSTDVAKEKSLLVQEAASGESSHKASESTVPASTLTCSVLWRGLVAYLSIGNVVDNISLALICCWVIRILSGAESGFTSQIAAITSALLWPRTIQFLAGWDKTAPYVRMSVAVTSDMKTFMGMLFVLVFGNAFVSMLLYPPNLVSQHPNGTSTHSLHVDVFGSENSTLTWRLQANQDKLAHERFGNMQRALMSSIDMLFSGWDIDEAKELAYSPALAELHYLSYVIFVPLIMLNLVIALMGGSYERIENSSKVRVTSHPSCQAGPVSRVPIVSVRLSMSALLTYTRTLLLVYSLLFAERGKEAACPAFERF